MRFLFLNLQDIFMKRKLLVALHWKFDMSPAHPVTGNSGRRHCLLKMSGWKLAPSLKRRRRHLGLFARTTTKWLLFVRTTLCTFCG